MSRSRTTPINFNQNNNPQSLMKEQQKISSGSNTNKQQQQQQHQQIFSKSPKPIFVSAKHILRKQPQNRTTQDNNLLVSLTKQSDFLAGIVQHVSLDCYKGIIKHADIEFIRERQILCHEGDQINNIIVLLQGTLAIVGTAEDQQQGDDGSMMMNKQLYMEKQSSTSAQITRSTKQNKIFPTLSTDQNIYNDLTTMSCREIQMAKKKAPIRRRSSIVMSAGMFLPPPLNMRHFQNLEFKQMVQSGNEYGARLRCFGRCHTNMLVSTEKCTIMVIETRRLIACFEQAFRAKLEATILKIKEVPIFSILENVKIHQILLNMKRLKNKRNFVLYKQGQHPQKLFILINGEIKLTKSTNLFEQNPNELYRDRRAMLMMNDNPKGLLTPLAAGTDTKSKSLMSSNSSSTATNSTKLNPHAHDLLPYANLTSLYNFRPMKKNIQIGIVTCSTNDSYSLVGEQEMYYKRKRQTDAVVASFEAEYYEIQIKKLEEILIGCKVIDEFYRILENSLRKIILYRQREYADKVNLQNKKHLDYFYVDKQTNVEKQSPRKYKIFKINNKMMNNKGVGMGVLGQEVNKEFHHNAVTGDNRQPRVDTGSHTNSHTHTQVQPFYTTFNFHRINNQSSSQSRRSRNNRSQTAKTSKDNKPNPNPKTLNIKKHSSIKPITTTTQINKPIQSTSTIITNTIDSQQQQNNALQDRLIGISHSWKPIKKKVGQQIKFMQNVSKKRQSIDLFQPLIDQEYFNFVEKEQRRIKRQFRVKKESLGRRK